MGGRPAVASQAESAATWPVRGPYSNTRLRKCQFGSAAVVSRPRAFLFIQS